MRRALVAIVSLSLLPIAAATSAPAPNPLKAPASDGCSVFDKGWKPADCSTLLRKRTTGSKTPRDHKIEYIYGIQSDPTSKLRVPRPPIPPKFGPPLYQAAATLKLDSFTSETDSFTNTPAISIQINTGSFAGPTNCSNPVGSPGQCLFGVQFVMNWNTGLHPTVCVWQISGGGTAPGFANGGGSGDPNSALYIVLCQTIPITRAKVLAQGDQIVLTGTTSKSITGKPQLTATVCANWDRFKIHRPLWPIDPVNECWAVSTPDHTGLAAGRWLHASASVFGLGNASNASFTGTKLETTVDVLACTRQIAGSACPAAGDLNVAQDFGPFAAANAFYDTAESNNLVQTSGQAVTANPGSAAPPLTCSKNDCTIHYTMVSPDLAP